jgi:hypothetical protein
VSRFASVGPAYDGTDKPDLDRGGSIVVAGELVSGSAIAAARVAADAAQQSGTIETVARNLLKAHAVADRGDLEPPPVPVTGLRVTQEAGSAAVTFTAGTFRRGDPTGGAGAVIVPAERLDLTLETSTGKGQVRHLTPPGGARDVLPGEYAYTIPRGVYADLAPGAYAFTVAARAPGQKRATLATSPVFTKK